MGGPKGLDGVELTVGDVISPDITEKECRKIASFASGHNIGLRTLASGTGWNCSLAAADPEEKKAAMSFVRKYLSFWEWLEYEKDIAAHGFDYLWNEGNPHICKLPTIKNELQGGM